ncbi:MAG: flagellar hook-associated protein FlgL [Ignavibacteriaceae bacterium]|nr:flagellar hook-associated protein FlgL [Ignavibacteriaceae bacterium]
MRVSDLLLSNNYISHFNDIKEKIAKINQQILTGEKISKPSDSPVGTSKLLRISDQLGQNETFKKNVQNSSLFLNETIFALESIQSEVQSVVNKFVELDNPLNQSDLNLYADIIDNSLSMILDYANSKTDGKYIFGGTDYSSMPYGNSSDNQTIETLTNTNGKMTVRFTQSVTQQINITGSSVFGTVVSFNGRVDANAVAGSTINNTQSVYDNYGNQYQLNTSLVKTADNTYQLSYDILDGTGTSVFSSSPAAKEVIFNSSNGQLISIDGSQNGVFDINVPSNRIHFSINLQSLTEKDSAASVNLTANQQTDIFNTLKRISTNLRNGILPSAEEKASVENFLSNVVSKLTDAGNALNQISTIEGMLNQQTYNLQELSDAENGVDQAKAIVDLQNQEYLLQISQKMAAMILPQSLLDYL